MNIHWRSAAIAVFAGTMLLGCAPETAQGQSSSRSAGRPDETPRAAKVDPQIAERLKHILVPLIAKMDRPIPLNEVKVGLIPDEHINAANGGGGNFYVTTGLLQKANDSRLRAILAHEVAHADLGHVAQHQRLNTGFQLCIILLDELFPGSRALTPLAGQLFENHYSRGDEHEADTQGVKILQRAGYDGKKLMVDALGWLAKTEGSSPGGFFATHPATGARIQAVQNLP
jgi:predicted Zn-dependent protease